MISGPRTVLVVDDDQAVRTLLETGLPLHLDGYSVATAVHGADAVRYLRNHPVDVLVTDVNMPVMDGFELLAYVRNHHPNLPVVVLSVVAPEVVHEGSPSLGLLRIVAKPSSVAEIAKVVLAARADVVKGHMSGVPLATLLQLMQLERKSCSLLVRSGPRKGRLHFLSGELVNAYSFELDTEGEEAARHLLGWDTVSIDFERSLHNHKRRIDTPLEALLLEVATQRDEAAAGRDATYRTSNPAPTDLGADVDGTAPDPVPDLSGTDALPAREPPVHEVSDGEEPSRVDGALTALNAALTDLRARSASTGHALNEAAPLVEDAGVALRAVLSRPAAAHLDDARVARAWREVAVVAERLAHAAEALAAPSHDSTDSDDPDASDG